jgi:hypothetical protein
VLIGCAAVGAVVYLHSQGRFRWSPSRGSSMGSAPYETSQQGHQSTTFANPLAGSSAEC